MDASTLTNTPTSDSQAKDSLTLSDTSAIYPVKIHSKQTKPNTALLYSNQFKCMHA